jgi:hypothetical protein
MDYDVNNNQMLSAGAFYQSATNQGDGWQPIAAAPHDGTIIEVRNTYGVAPWFGLFRWTDKMSFRDQDGKTREMIGPPRWAQVGQDQSSFDESKDFTWRPYSGSTSAYVDPTGGAQDSPAYWRGAVAEKYGLPLNAFEGTTKRNLDRADPSFLERVSNWLFGK